MSYRRLFILCEGNDDRRFFERIIVPLLDYDYVHCYQYAEQKSKEVHNLIRSAQSMGADYVYIRDFDQGECIPSRKGAVTEKYGNLDPERIFIVKEEIESWYAAGLSDEVRRQLDVPLPRRTDEVTKEEFDNALPQGEPRISIMREMLEAYDLTMAQQRNRSFDYFCGKFL